METQGQWCDQKFCRDFGKIGAHNINIYSHAENRYYCATCHHTFNADNGTFFDTLRTDRNVLLDGVAMLVERNSLRAISRIKHCKPNTVLPWLDLAGQHAAAVSKHFMRGLHLTQAQIDELWTFVKKKQEHLQLDDPSNIGDAWIWRAITLPSHLRVVTHLSHDRSEKEATAFLSAFKARTDGRPPLCTSDKLPAYIEALIANDRMPEPPPRRRQRGRPRKQPRRVLDPDLR
jgi:hypothetical protein